MVGPAAPARWLALGPSVASLLLVAANLRASLTGVGPLLDEVAGDLHMSSVSAGLLTAVPLVAFAAVSPAVPALARRIGMERALLAALLGLVVGVAVRSTPSLIALFAGTAVLGVAIAIGNVLLPALIKRDFAGSIGALTGGCVTVMALSGALAAGVAVPLSQATAAGWRTALGYWLLPALLAAFVWLPRALDPAPATPTRSARPVPIPWRAGLAWAVTLFMGLQSLGYYVLIAWLPTVLHGNGFTAEAAGWYLFGQQALAVLTSLAIPLAIRRLPDQRLLAAGCSLGSLLGFLSLLALPHHPLVPVVLLGVGSGASIVLALSFMGLRTPDAPSTAALSGMAQAIGYLLAATGPALFGLLRSVTGGTTAPILLVCLTALAQAVAGFLAGRGSLPGADHEHRPQQDDGEQRAGRGEREPVRAEQRLAAQRLPQRQQGDAGVAGRGDQDQPGADGLAAQQPRPPGQ
ncbi:MFS transporter [Pseudonocardia eucalypti]|uniref:MFS transporter n=1 Tax=Pseudonocardia eucalypti TaxID=648755 RepID=A0ABP9QCF6_9PSEU